MDSPSSKPSPTVERSSPETAVDTLTRAGDATLQIAGESGAGRKSNYSILVQGEVRSSSILSSKDPEESVTTLENDTKLLSGSVFGENAGFVFAGDVLAAEFDDPEPTIKLDGTIVDPGRWLTVKEYVGYGPAQESVEDPFSTSGDLGAARGDPSNPETYVIELEADGLDETGAYCLDIDGQVLDSPESITIPEKGDRVYGCLRPGCSVTVEVRGVVTRIDTPDGVDCSVQARGND